MNNVVSPPFDLFRVAFVARAAQVCRSSRVRHELHNSLMPVGNGEFIAVKQACDLGK
jgi:hypothetical protein